MEAIDVSISGAEATAPEEILALLAAVDLPREGVRERLSGFLVARDLSGRLVGCIGLERYGDLGARERAGSAEQGGEVRPISADEPAQQRRGLSWRRGGGRARGCRR